MYYITSQAQSQVIRAGEGSAWSHLRTPGASRLPLHLFVMSQGRPMIRPAALSTLRSENILSQDFPANFLGAHWSGR